MLRVCQFRTGHLHYLICCELFAHPTVHGSNLQDRLEKDDQVDGTSASLAGLSTWSLQKQEERQIVEQRNQRDCRRARVSILTTDVKALRAVEVGYVSIGFMSDYCT
jgi:hypothetical protein